MIGVELGISFFKMSLNAFVMCVISLNRNIQ